MKSVLYNIIVLVSWLLVFTACEKNEGFSSNKQGTLVLSMDVAPVPDVAITKATVDVNDFILKIQKNGEADGSVFSGTYSELKNKGTLSLDPAGYTISVVQAEVFPATSDYPFYKGNNSFTISSGEPTAVQVTCKMQNTKIKIDLSGIVSSFRPGTLKAKIEDTTGGVINHVFTIENNQTEVYFFDPSKSWRLVLEGTTTDGYELGTLGLIPLEAFVANTYKILQVQIGQEAKMKTTDGNMPNIPVLTVKTLTVE